MSLRLKFNLVLALVCLVGFLGAQYYVHGVLIRQARAEVSALAQASMYMAQAVRLHTSSKVKPIFDSWNWEIGSWPHEIVGSKGVEPTQAAAQGKGFTPQGIPAMAAKETMRLFNEKYPGHGYREVALNPTNPLDLATGWEKDLIDQYRSGAVVGEYEQLTQGPSGWYLNLARPFKITDPSCLACHGKPQDAPPGMLAAYGDQHGFGWQLGEIIGAQILMVPAAEPLAKAQALYRGFLALLGGSFLLLFLALNITLYRLVIVPINRTNKLLEKIAAEDELTGVCSRRHFLDLLQKALMKSKIEGRPLSVILFDVDRFKQINDTYGHGVGDEVLRQICRFLLQTTKQGDHLGRVGGDEFTLLLPATPLPGALALAQRLCHSLAQLPFDKVGQVTCSFGVVQSLEDDTTTSLLKRADEQLYVAKAAGRHRVE
jgi:diguanylate cyclase (GGDEF)-like protein